MKKQRTGLKFSCSIRIVINETKIAVRLFVCYIAQFQKMSILPLQNGLEFPGGIGGDSVRPTLHWEKCGQGVNPGPSIICGLGFLLLFFSY